EYAVPRLNESFPRSRLSSLRLGDCKKVVLPPYEDHSIRDGRRRHQRLAHRISRQQLVLGPGLNNKNLAVLTGQVQLPISGNRRSAVRPAFSTDPFLVNALPGLRIAAYQGAHVVVDVQIFAIDQRSGHVSSALLEAPGHEFV